MADTGVVRSEVKIVGSGFLEISMLFAKTVKNVTDSITATMPVVLRFCSCEREVCAATAGVTVMAQYLSQLSRYRTSTPREKTIPGVISLESCGAGACPFMLNSLDRSLLNRPTRISLYRAIVNLRTTG